MNQAPDVTVHRSDEAGCATLTLDSPHNRNALSLALVAALEQHLGEAMADDDVRVVELTGSGPVFCAGADLKEVASGKGGTETVARLLDAIRTGPKPVVCRLNGPARAGGVGLMAACDIVVAPDTVTFAFTEVRLGVVPAMISVPVLARIPAAAARDLFLTGRTFSAEEAVRIGLINAAVPAAEVESVAARYVADLSLGGPEALTITRRLLDEVPREEPGAAMKRMQALSAERFGNPEGIEGIMAWREKRPPSWVPGSSSTQATT